METSVPRRNALECAFISALALSLATPAVAHASGPAGHAAASSLVAVQSASSQSNDPAGDQVGDLSKAAEDARAKRVAEPTTQNWTAEGEAFEALGDFGAAGDAYQGAIDSTEDPAELQAARADLQRVRDDSRGRVADEPASKHRMELDARRAPAAPPEPKVAVKPTAPPADTAPANADDRIVTKWYFWVTIGAIVASAAAVTAISIKASRDERGDSLDALGRGPSNGPTRGPSLLRF